MWIHTQTPRLNAEIGSESSTIGLEFMELQLRKDRAFSPSLWDFRLLSGHRDVTMLLCLRLGFGSSRQNPFGVFRAATLNHTLVPIPTTSLLCFELNGRVIIRSVPRNTPLYLYERGCPIRSL